MRLDDAIAYIREYRESQGLDPISSFEEYQQARIHLYKKSIEYPDILHLNGEKLIYANGVYKNMATERMTPVNETEAELYKYDPMDQKTIFYSLLYKCKVRMTGNLKQGGIYYVSKLGEGYQVYPDFAKNLTPLLDSDNDNDAKGKDLEFLEINRTNWADLKNWILDKFVSSYPWQRYGDDSPQQIKSNMEQLVKSKNKGLTSIILIERSINGNFINKEEFINRMNAQYNKFPWIDFVETLDFSY